jgi:hypothetical protein
MSQKVLDSTGRLVTRDHPHEIISPHVMRFEEIRWWLKELSTNPAYGWTDGGGKGLVRALGATGGKSWIRGKLSTYWIWPREQVRLTARINDILQGYIVPRRFPGHRVEGVITNPPRPPQAVPVRRLHFTALPGRLQLTAHDSKPPPKLPSFARAFSEAIEWDPDKKAGPKGRRGRLQRGED